MDLLERVRTALADRYAIGDEIGRGGMAVVFSARDLKHDREVAVKVLRLELSISLGADRFLREIHIAAQLQHPHIVPLYDSGEVDGLLYYVMPYLDGETLRERIEREGPLQFDDAFDIVTDVAKALDHAHAVEVVHRDVKPENIWLSGAEALVLDFGIARALSEAGAEALTDSGVAIGTPEYMSPEQASGAAEIDSRSDVYSLACVLFEMLAGEPPFTGPNAQAIIARHVSQEAPSVRVIRPTVPRGVERAIGRGLAKVPADRYSAAGAFAAALSESADADGRASWARRHPVASMLMAAGAVVLLWAGWFAAERTVFPDEHAGLDPSRIAVLYFADRSSDRSLRHIADGLTEDLIDELSDVEGLDVVPPSGVQPFASSSVSLDSITRALAVGSIVEGTVSETAQGLRVTVRLVDPVSGSQLNSRTLEAPERDLYQLQDAMTVEVARFLRESLGSEIEVREGQARAGNAQAWELVQMAGRLRHDAERIDRLAAPGQAERTLRRADSLLAEAQRLAAGWVEPTIERGWVAAARAALAEGSHGRASALGDTLAVRPIEPSVSLLARGIEHAERALEEHRSSAAAFELRGVLRYRQWQYGDPQRELSLLDSAVRDLNRAVELDPSLAHSWAALSRIYRRKGDFTSAEQTAREALRADAYLRDAASVVNAGFFSALDAGSRQRAEYWCQEAQQRFPDDLRFAECRLVFLNYFGNTVADVTEAWSELRQVNRRDTSAVLAESRPYRQLMVAAVLARAGLADSARAVMRRNRAAIEGGRPRQKAGFYEAHVYMLLGETDSVLARLAEYIEGYPRQREYIASHRWFRPLRNASAFDRLVRAPTESG
ncbi:MAG: protein kinase [Gemmatimonadales bacterium]|jgi:serine/threonine-protein kinase